MNKLIAFALHLALAVGCGCTTASVPRNASLRTGDGPLIQAHRGGRGEYEDNAAGGFAWCLSKGIRGFETDVRFTKDRRLVIMHDTRVNRTTGGEGVVEELTLDELRKFRLQACSEPVPAAEEVMGALRGRDDSHVRIKGMDHIVITDYKNFANAVGVLLK